eukprot:TRINITY_DN2233_c0_g1_i2.p1 TRINITY_DN2233_c0_g1~~TRINITY_DN2233_c0_g1_i2.p1  ORF type:complete len:454 (+),score=55.40 TRINITY_DN2233_c0_g1_i2:1164-2525(+)
MVKGTLAAYLTNVWKVVDRPGVLSCLQNASVCSSEESCIDGYCLKRYGSAAIAQIECEGAFLSRSGHCCTSPCASGTCSDCSTGVCLPSATYCDAASQMCTSDTFICLLQNGRTATSPAECYSGILSRSGHCCASECANGTCSDCSTGICLPSTAYCDAANQLCTSDTFRCLLMNGRNATSPSECFSGILSASGHCCSSSCSGVCTDCSTGSCLNSTSGADCSQPLPPPPTTALGCSNSTIVPPPNATNIVCIDGKLQYTIPAGEFLGNSSSPVTIPPNVQVQLTGNISVSNISLTLQVKASESGLIIVSGCLRLESGQITISVDNISSLVPASGSTTIELMRIEKPECFVDQLNSTVIVTTEPAQCRTVSGTKQTQAPSPGVQSLVVVLTLSTADDCTNKVVGDAIPVGVIAGVVSAVVVEVIVARIAVLLYRRSQRRAEARKGAQEKFDSQ